MKPIQQKNVSPVSDGDTIKVTACILTLDEEDFIEDCLKHLKPHVDCILVLDGGSSDKTFDIARRYANAVIVRPFRGSFAVERNYVQEMAPTDWVLHCDADERFHEEFLRNIREIILESNVKCFRFPRVNLDQAYPHQSDPKDHQVRLLDRRCGVWVRPVHEILWSPEHGKPLDQCGSKYIQCLSQYPITHLKRPENHRERILERWEQLRA